MRRPRSAQTGKSSLGAATPTWDFDTCGFMDCCPMTSEPSLQDDELLYSFLNADQILDFLLSIGMNRSSSSVSYRPRSRRFGRRA